MMMMLLHEEEEHLHQGQRRPQAACPPSNRNHNLPKKHSGWRNEFWMAYEYELDLIYNPIPYNPICMHCTSMGQQYIIVPRPIEQGDARGLSRLSLGLTVISCWTTTRR